MNVGFLIIARLKSTRLQRKVLLDVEGKPVLGHLVERLRGAKLINDIIICTSTNPQDNDIEKWAVSQDVKMFRGDEDDVLKRLSDACRKYSLDYILHITGDCPFVDPLYCDMVVEAFLENDADLITTFGLPHGAYIYGIKPSALDSVLKIKQDSDTEVWGRYFTDVDLFTIHSLPVEPKHNRPELRGTLDYPEDYAYIKKVFSALYEDGKIFTLDEWIKYHDAHPEIASINQDCEERYRKRWLGQSEITLKPRYRVNSAAIIGAGSIGRRHIKNLQALGITNIVALRSYKGHFKELPSEFGVQEMTSLDNLVASKPDVAIIANPTNLHLSTARSLLPFVKGIFIDKPLSHTLDHVSEFVAEVSKFKKVCFVGYNLQFHAGFKKISEFLQGDIPGKIISFQGNIGHWLPGWHPYENYLNTYPAKRELGGGAMLTLVHEINLAISWLGRPIKVTAICSPHEELGISEVDVISDIMTLHESGAVSQIHMDFVQKRFHRTGVISCENGWISYDYASNQILFYEKNTTDSQVLWSASNYDINDSYLAMIKTFIRYTKEGRIKHAYDASCGALDVEHVCAALQSDKIKQWVEVGSSTLNVARG